MAVAGYRRRTCHATQTDFGYTREVVTQTSSWGVAAGLPLLHSRSCSRGESCRPGRGRRSRPNRTCYCCSFSGRSHYRSSCNRTDWLFPWTAQPYGCAGHAAVLQISAGFPSCKRLASGRADPCAGPPAAALTDRGPWPRVRAIPHQHSTAGSTRDRGIRRHNVLQKCCHPESSLIRIGLN